MLGRGPGFAKLDRAADLLREAGIEVDYGDELIEIAEANGSSAIDALDLAVVRYAVSRRSPAAVARRQGASLGNSLMRGEVMMRGEAMGAEAMTARAMKAEAARCDPDRTLHSNDQSEPTHNADHRGEHSPRPLWPMKVSNSRQ